MEAVKVINNRPRLFHVSEPGGLGRKARIIKPGVNLIERPLFDKLSKEIAFIEWVKAGDLTIELGATTMGTLKSLGELKPLDAVKLVTETLDVQLLEAWKAAEARPKVLASIDTQLATIEAQVRG